jgi:hypothetical protein
MPRLTIFIPIPDAKFTVSRLTKILPTFDDAETTLPTSIY